MKPAFEIKIDTGMSRLARVLLIYVHSDKLAAALNTFNAGKTTDDLKRVVDKHGRPLFARNTVPANPLFVARFDADRQRHWRVPNYSVKDFREHVGTWREVCSLTRHQERLLDRLLVEMDMLAGAARAEMALADGKLEDDNDVPF